MENATVMTAKELRAQIQRRACTVALCRLQTKDRVKEMIRAEGGKVSQYSAKDLAIMAEDYLNDPVHREEILAKVKPWVEEFLTKRRR